MKQFSLEEYLNNPSRKVVTRDGRPVRIICTDAKDTFPIIGLIEENDKEYIRSYRPDGLLCSGSCSNYDLCFDTEKKEGWVNLYRTKGGRILTCGVFETKEVAIGDIDKNIEYYKHIDTIQIQWEE